ncbi:MAG: HD-GYP domain-containing protein [Acidimicrobiales bacterium]
MPPTSEHPDPPRAVVDPPQGEWKARPLLAWMIRAGLIAVPLVISWLSVRFAMGLVRRPDGLGPSLGWFLGAVVLSSLVFQLVRRLIRRFSSLGVLFSLSLTFPDAAPSRMRAFLRSGADDERDRPATLTGSQTDTAVTAKRLAALVTKVSRREVRSGRHSDRVRGYAELIAAELGLAQADIERLRWATLLHDVGMLDVPQRVLDTRGGLSAEDRVLVEQHPVHAIGHLAPFADWLGPWSGAATDHHERWDGSGYPAGLAGEQISLAGRIVAVADAYDAMTALRSYKKPMSPAAARRELVDHAGTQFDPTVVRAFLSVGIHPNRSGVGALGALAEIPGQLLQVVSGAGTGAGAAVASAVFVAASAAAVPAISVEVQQPAVQVERVVDAVDEPVVETNASTTTRPPTTTRAPSTTAVSTTTLVPSTTTLAPATTTRPAPTTPPPAPTAPPTTTPPPTVTTTVPAYPTLPPVTTTLPVPGYPTT